MPVKTNTRLWLALAHDVVAAAVAWWAAFLFRLNFDLGPPYSTAMWQTMVWVVPLKRS